MSIATLCTTMAALVMGLAAATARAAAPAAPALPKAPTELVAPAEPQDPDAPGPLKRGAGYLGAMILYQLSDVTVVYPAGPGQDAATDRRSAQARAAFLRSVHGVNARVVSDVEVSEDDLRGNLLVLGWDNALLREKRLPRSFERRADGVVLLGEPVGDATDDLLLINRSPFAADRFLVFWSRIDPERDRFMVLPRVGSDWAVIRDFRTIRQGMFLPGGAWPPVRDRDAEGDHESKLSEVEGALSVVSTEHFAIHYEADRIAQAELQGIVKAREAAYAKAVASLGAPIAGFRIDLKIYEDEKTKKEATGVEDLTHTLPRVAEIHMTRRAARAASARDETHVLARARIGPAYLTCFYEGLGVALDGSWRGRDLDLEAALISEAGRLPTIKDLLDEERFRKLIDGPGLPAAGLFVAWLRATRPVPLFPRIYGMAEGSPAALAKILGRSESDLEAEFRGWVAERTARRADDVAVAKAEMEAKDRLAAGDFDGVAAALERARARKPQDPQILFNLASALMRTPRLADAEAAFRKILTLPLGRGETRFRIFSLYQIGRILDLTDKREQALETYRKVLEMPDEFDAHRLARERIASPATREQLE